jgi:serine O-acetyltransferase
MFDDIRADFHSHGRKLGSQGFWVMLVYRYGRWRYGIRPILLRKPFSLCYKVLEKLVHVATGVELPCEAVVGRNFVIDHFGGIVISGYARFGDNCRIRTGVVVGLARVDDPCAPVFGSNVDIGAGAKVLGRITIGDNVAIGANSVVTCDVPSDSIAVGVPARVKSRRNTTPPPGLPRQSVFSEPFVQPHLTEIEAFAEQPLAVTLRVQASVSFCSGTPAHSQAIQAGLTTDTARRPVQVNGTEVLPHPERRP